MSSHEEPGMAAEPEEDEIISNNSEYASRESSGLLDSSVPAANHGDDSGEPSHPATKKPRLEEGDGHSRGTAAAATDGADISAVSGGSDVAVVAANRAVTGDEGEEENVGVGQEEHNTPPDPGNGCRDRGEIGALGVDHDDEGGSAPQTRAMVNQESDAADEDGQAFGGVLSEPRGSYTNTAPTPTAATAIDTNVGVNDTSRRLASHSSGSAPAPHPPGRATRPFPGTAVPKAVPARRHSNIDGGRFHRGDVNGIATTADVRRGVGVVAGGRGRGAGIRGRGVPRGGGRGGKGGALGFTGMERRDSITQGGGRGDGGVGDGGNAAAGGRSPTALATHSWGLESHKGGVREMFTATVDGVKMVKVWANGDVTINTGTKGRTLEAKIILNLALGVFKVEIAADDGAADGEEAVWRIVHKSGYKQPFSENMNMSLFANREWHFVKTKLKRLPTTIFLPKARLRSPAGAGETLRSGRQRDGERYRQRTVSAVPKGPEEEGVGVRGGLRGGVEYSVDAIAGVADLDDKIFRHFDHREYADEQTVGRGSEYQQRSAAAALAAIAAAFAHPNPQTRAQAASVRVHGNSAEGVANSPLGLVMENPTAALAAAAIKEGVPPHIVHNLMMSSGAASVAATAAASAPYKPRNNSAGGGGAGGNRTEAHREERSGGYRGGGDRDLVSAVGDHGRGRSDDGGKWELDHGWNGTSASSGSSVRETSRVPFGLASSSATPHRLPSDFDDPHLHKDGNVVGRSRHGGSPSYRPHSNSGSIGHPYAGAAVDTEERRPTPSPEVWRPWRSGDSSASASPPASSASGRAHDSHGNRYRGGGDRRGARAHSRELSDETGDGGREGGWWGGGGKWEERQGENEEGGGGRKRRAPGRDGEGFSTNGRGNSRDRNRSEERARWSNRRRRSDHGGSDGFRSRLDGSRGRDDSRGRRGWSSQERPSSSPREQLSPFSRALAIGSSSGRAPDAFGRGSSDTRGGRQSGGEYSGKGSGADAQDHPEENDTSSGLRDEWRHHDDASTGRPGSRAAEDGEGAEYHSSRSGGDRGSNGEGEVSGGLEPRRESYNPDQYDPNAYDPGEVMVKRETSNLSQSRGIERSASTESLTEEGTSNKNKPHGSPSASQSPSRGRRNDRFEREGSEIGTDRFGTFGSTSDGQQAVTSSAAPGFALSNTIASSGVEPPLGVQFSPQGRQQHAGGVHPPGASVVSSQERLAIREAGQGGYPAWELRAGCGVDEVGGVGTGMGAELVEHGQPIWQQQQPQQQQQIEGQTQPQSVPIPQPKQDHPQQWHSQQMQHTEQLQQQQIPQQHQQQQIPQQQHQQQQIPQQQHQQQQIPQQQQQQQDTVYLNGDKPEDEFAVKLAPDASPPPPPPRSSVWISGGSSKRRGRR